MATGAGPSVRPSSRRSASSMTAAVVKPMIKVTMENARMAIEAIARVPCLPISRPAGICETAYPRKKKLEIAPMVKLSRWNSSRMNGSTAPMLARSAIHTT